MSEQTYKLNSRLATPEGEYLIQTVNDQKSKRVLSSVFSDGELLETQDELLRKGMSSDEVLKRVKEMHEERTRELEYLVGIYKEVVGGEDAKSMVFLGQALFYKKMFSESMKLFTQAVTVKPDYHEAWVHLGMVQFKTKKWNDACVSFSKCVELCPEFADYRNHLGEAYLALDSCKRAVIEFEEAIKLNVYYGEAYLNLAMAYILNAIKREDFKLFSSQTEKTEEMLRKAEVIMPDIVNEDYLDGRKYLENGDLENAFQKFLHVREIGKDRRRQEFLNSYLKFMLGASKINEKFLTKQIKSLKKAISVNPHYADLHHELAVVYTLLGSFIHTKAVEEYKKALAINPNFRKAKRNLKLAENEIKGFELLVKAIVRE